MIMADLKTNYVDDVLDTTKNQLRKYQQIQNDDGTVSFVDVTKYTQVGTSFGAKDINDTNAAINDVNGNLVTSEKDGDWIVYKFPDGTFIAENGWASGNAISMSNAYGNIYTSTSFNLVLPQNVITVNDILGSSSYLGGGIGGTVISDQRASVKDLSSVPFYFWSATSLSNPTKATFMCFGTWK